MKDTIGQNIQSLRTRLAMTQEELAQRLGVARQTVAKWESGDAIPDLGNASKLADVLGVSLDALVHQSLESYGRLGCPSGMLSPSVGAESMGP